MVFSTLYPCCFDPPFHMLNPNQGILTRLPMAYRTPYPWYFDPPTYLLIINERIKIPWGSIQHRGGSVLNKGVNIPQMKFDPGIRIPWESKYHMSARTLLKSIYFSFMKISSVQRAMFNIGVGLPLVYRKTISFVLV